MVMIALSPSRLMLCTLQRVWAHSIGVAELQIAGILPVGHVDGRGRVAVVAGQFESGGRLAPGPRRPHAVDVKLAEIVDRGRRLPASLLVRLPARRPACRR